MKQFDWFSKRITLYDLASYSSFADHLVNTKANHPYQNLGTPNQRPHLFLIDHHVQAPR